MLTCNLNVKVCFPTQCDGYIIGIKITPFSLKKYGFKSHCKIKNVQSKMLFLKKMGTKVLILSKKNSLVIVSSYNV